MDKCKFWASLFHVRRLDPTFVICAYMNNQYSRVAVLALRKTPSRIDRTVAAVSHRRADQRKQLHLSSTLTLPVQSERTSALTDFPAHQHSQTPEMTTAPPVYPQHPGSPQLHQMAYEQPRLVHQQGQYFPPQSMQQQQQQDKQCQYQTATPLASLNRSPAPVDCPSCGERAMTVTSFESGNTTQYVDARSPRSATRALN